MMASTPEPRRIPLWKLVGGAAVHCLVPAYVIALGVDGWHVATHGGGGLAAWLAQAPGFSGWFMGAYAGLGAGATGVAALIPTRQRAAPALDGAAHLRMALAQGRGAFGAQADEALGRIAALRLGDFAGDPASDPAVAPMLRDLAAMVGAGRAALAVGEDEPVRAMTAEAIGHIARELEAWAGQGAQQARDRAQVMAGYVARRYGQDEI